MECVPSKAHWSDREWVMTVIDQAGYIYAIGGSNYNGEETLNDVWRSAASLHNIPALQDQCHLPALRSGCSSYGLVCIPPSLPGGASTVVQQSANGSIVVSCSACPLPSGSQVASTSYIAAVAAAVAFALAFTAAVAYLYVLRRRASSAGQTALFSGSLPSASSGRSSDDALSKPMEFDQSGASYHNL